MHQAAPTWAVLALAPPRCQPPARGPGVSATDPYLLRELGWETPIFWGCAVRVGARFLPGECGRAVAQAKVEISAATFIVGHKEVALGQDSDPSTSVNETVDRFWHPDRFCIWPTINSKFTL
jgi:hypothetical protein